MSKRDELIKGLGNVRESMGDFAAGTMPGGTTPGPKALPPYLVGVVRSKDVSQIAIDRIDRDPGQPREEFDQEGLERLAQSLRQRGLLQPIRVRWDAARERYIIVCGERRWRAARMAGLESLACVIVQEELTPEERLAVQLVENALREDLRPIEQAKAYKTLMEAQGWSFRQLAGELSIHHGQVVRALSLLELPQGVQDQVEQGALSPASAYEVTKLPDRDVQAELAGRAIAEKMTRQEVIEAVKERKAGVVRRAPAERRGPFEYRVGDNVIVTVRYRKNDKLTPAQALRQALKQAQAEERGPAGGRDHEEAA
jgi:ParB family chromosome partitioning protein